MTLLSFINESEWTGYQIHTTKKGYTIHYWSHIQGEQTGAVKFLSRSLVPANAPEDLAEEFNAGLSWGEYIASVAAESGRTIKRGILVE